MKLYEILREQYNNAYNGESVASIHLFGIEYGQKIREENYNVRDIIEKAGLNESYVAELNKGIKLSEKVTIDNILDVNNLASILKEEYNNAKYNNESVVSIHLFGIKYGNLIRRKNLSIDEIIKKSGLPNSYKTELSKGIKLSKFVN